jgi:ubiquinone/menaquinone biosynthesis C-methylase UbiE
MTDTYDPQTYWDARAASYAPGDCGVLATSLLWWIDDQAVMGESMLEVGSGNGRIYELVVDLCPDMEFGYQMVDIAPKMIAVCEAATGIKPQLWDGQRLPYDDNIFDWVLSFSVMLHVPPADIAQHIAEHARVSRRFVFVSTYTGIASSLSSHCFRHAYEQLFEQAGLAVVERRRFKREQQTQWLLGVGSDG